jgi:hypothetical protein
LGSLKNINEELVLQTMSKSMLNDDLERKDGDLDKQTSMKEFFGSHETTTSKKVEPYIVWLKL